METYSVRVTKDYLVFCSAHFITYKRNKCECIHGHNYRIAAEVTGELDGNFLVVDFIDLKRILRDLTDQLDHRVLLPRDNRLLRLEETEEEIAVYYGDKKRWIFPREDCLVLPVANTTAELLARWIAGQLQEELKRSGYSLPRRIRIELEESAGQSGHYEIECCDP